MGFAYLESAENSVLAIAHRGGAIEAERQHYVENTVPAFMYVTRELEYTHIETDVRADAAENLYIWHGKGTERLDKKNPLKQADLDRIREGCPDAAPLLEDILDGFPDTHFSLDAKHWPAVEPLARVVAKTNAVDRVCINSFSQARTDTAAMLISDMTGKEVCTGFGIGDTFTLLGRAAIPGRSWKAPNAVAPLPRCLVKNEPVIRAAHNGGAKVHVWTVNTELEMRNFLDLGVDGIITDEPTILKKVMKSRGLWKKPAA